MKKGKKSLAFTHRKLAKEWHPTKNGKLSPKDVTSGSGKKVWWKCKKGHEWQTNTFKRTGKFSEGCPYCSNHRVCTDNCLYTVNPKLSKDWHPAKNGKLTTKDITPGSLKKVWWQCTHGHAWLATISSRNNGNGCPYCSGRKASNKNNLAKKHPKIAKEWHLNKNNPLTPKDVTPSSGRAVWWKCSKCKHEWKSAIYTRTRSHAPNKCFKCKSLASKYPESIKEWHPTKNRKLTPWDVTPSSQKIVWWKCSKCKHEWKSKVEKRACLVCKNIIITKINSLNTLYPKISKEWHPTKNGKLTTNDVGVGISKKVWWKCKKNHVWQASIRSRTQRNNNCPYCSNHRLSPENSLHTRNPALAKEWHPTKNGKRTPKDVIAGSGKKAWWKCKRGHEWPAVISSRKTRRCPKCHNRVSMGELRIFCEFKKLFNTTAHQVKLYKFSCDIFIPELKIVIEHDGGRFHYTDKKQQYDKNKTKTLKKTWNNCFSNPRKKFEKIKLQRRLLS